MEIEPKALKLYNMKIMKLSKPKLKNSINLLYGKFV